MERDKFTQHFDLKQLTTTSSKYSNVPNDEQICNLRILSIKVLQPSRDFLGVPIFVNSGFRSRKVNESVGGAWNSEHTLGTAVDITTRNRANNIRLYDYIRDNCTYNQLINEYDYSWIHVSYTIHEPNKKQQLKIG